MCAMASQITSLTIVYSTVYSGADQSKHQSSAPLAFVWGIHRGAGEFPAQMARNAENVSIWWRHHVFAKCSRKAACHLDDIIWTLWRQIPRVSFHWLLSVNIT